MIYQNHLETHPKLVLLANVILCFILALVSPTAFVAICLLIASFILWATSFLEPVMDTLQTNIDIPLLLQVYAVLALILALVITAVYTKNWTKEKDALMKPEPDNSTV